MDEHDYLLSDSRITQINDENDNPDEMITIPIETDSEDEDTQPYYYNNDTSNHIGLEFDLKAENLFRINDLYNLNNNVDFSRETIINEDHQHDDDNDNNFVNPMDVDIDDVMIKNEPLVHQEINQVESYISYTVKTEEPVSFDVILDHGTSENLSQISNISSIMNDHSYLSQQEVTDLIKEQPNIKIVENITPNSDEQIENLLKLLENKLSEQTTGVILKAGELEAPFHVIKQLSQTFVGETDSNDLLIEYIKKVELQTNLLRDKINEKNKSNDLQITHLSSTSPTTESEFKKNNINDVNECNDKNETSNALENELEASSSTPAVETLEEEKHPNFRNLNILRQFESTGKELLSMSSTLKLKIGDKNLEEATEEINKAILKFQDKFRLLYLNTLIDIDTQTDEILLSTQETAKKLNEKCKQRHLASSSSDMSDENSDDSYSMRRVRRHVKTKRLSTKENEKEEKKNLVHDFNVNSPVHPLKTPDITMINEEHINDNNSVTDNLIYSTDTSSDDMKNKKDGLDEFLEVKTGDSDTDKTNSERRDSMESMNVDENLEIIFEEDPEDEENNEIGSIIVTDHDKKGAHTLEEYNDILREKEIDRLTNLSTLEIRRSDYDHNKYDTVKSTKKKKADELIDILKNAERKDDSDDSYSDNENIITEEQFLHQKNMEFKERLLKSSSSDSEQSDLEGSKDQAKNDYSTDAEESDDSTLMTNFLDTMIKKKVQDEIRTDMESLETEALNVHSPNNDNMPDENDKVESKKNDAIPITDKLTKNVDNDEIKEVIGEEKLETASAVLDSNQENNDNVRTEFDMALENFWKEGTATQEEFLKAVIETCAIHDEIEETLTVKDSKTSENQPKKRENEKENEIKAIENVSKNNVETIVIDEKETEAALDAEDSNDSNLIKPKLKMDSLDKQIFNKKIFDIMNDESSIEKDKDQSLDSKITADDDSDCEILDVSMFQTRKPTKDTDVEKLIAVKKTRVHGKTANDDCISLSSDSELDLDSVQEEEEDDRKRNIRAMLSEDQLTVETKQAQKEESERVKRLEKKNDLMAQLIKKSKNKDELILDFDTKRKTNIVVHSDIVKQLKKHQVDGVKFMYDTCYGSVDHIEKFPGSGCILAHCMGLGKTLQLIALLHTVISYPQLKTNRILVICPKSTVMNWAEEIQRWLGPIKAGPRLKVFHFPDNSDINEKIRILTEWHHSGSTGYSKSGCLLIGYEAFRALVFYHLSKKKSINLIPHQIDVIVKKVEDTLLNPGADLIICDEGHVIKNRKSATNVAVSKVKTRRRIILTGTPIQNNLKEYYCMVNFIKPSFLGTEKEFANLYANPIKNGQHKDSSKSEIKFMKQRSFVLHRKLSRFVQRREAAILKSFLPEKLEYVLFVPMTDIQERLYEYFLENNPLKEKYGGKSLIPDYTFLRKIWTHPKVLENAWQNALKQKEKRDLKARKTMNQFSDDDQPDDLLDSQIGKMSVTSDWWRQHILPQDLESLMPSNKLRVMFEILKLCQENGEKCLIFSAFVAVLNVVELFMKKIHAKESCTGGLGLERFSGPWMNGQDYYRLDGKTPKSVRHAMITRFNDPMNTRTKCFLISSKAGGQGINLIGANRVIILDTSWNPSNDQQNIFRIFRLGQKRKCFIYRLLAMGTMEEKVYSRSVTKQAMSFRVVDEQQIDRHYNMAELAELYTLTKTDYTQRPVPIRPLDDILSSLLHNCPDIVYKYHEHDSLLENKPEQDLSEADKAEAWAAYEKDVNMQRTGVLDAFGMDSNGLLNSPQNYRPGNPTLPVGFGGGGMHQQMRPYGGNFGIVNNVNYNNILSNFNYPFQSNLGLGQDANLLRLNRMYQNPPTQTYTNPYSINPSSAQSVMGSTPYGGSTSSGLSSLFSSALSANSPMYYKTGTNMANNIIPTPSTSSTIRPMSGSFETLRDMANYLAVPSPSTPPNIPPISSPMSTLPTNSSSSVSSSYLSKELDTGSMWNYLSNANALEYLASGLFGNTSQNIPITTQNYTLPTATNPLTTQNLPKQNKINANPSKYSSYPKDMTVNSLNHNIAPLKQITQQPSIPTSVITKTAKPTPPTPVSESLPPPLMTSTYNNVERNSPKAHTIIKPKNTKTVNEAKNPPSPSTMVKNFNMGIVYPGQRETSNKISVPTEKSNFNIKNIAAHQLSSLAPKKYGNQQKIPVTKSITYSVTPQMTTTAINTSTSSSNITVTPTTNSNSLLTINQSHNKSNLSAKSMNSLTKNNTKSYQVVSGINLSELSKSGGLSITPVTTSKTLVQGATNKVGTATNLSGVTVKPIMNSKNSATLTTTTTTANKSPITNTQHSNSIMNILPANGANVRRVTPSTTTSANNTNQVIPHLVAVTKGTPILNKRQSVVNSIKNVVGQHQSALKSNVLSNKAPPPLVLTRSHNPASKPVQYAPASKAKITPVNAASAPKTNLTLNQTNSNNVINSRKRKLALNDLSSNSSLTITELKKSQPMTKAMTIQNSIKRMKGFDGITIVPRPTQNSKKDNIMDVVELD